MPTAMVKDDRGREIREGDRVRFRRPGGGGASGAVTGITADGLVVINTEDGATYSIKAADVVIYAKDTAMATSEGALHHDELVGEPQGMTHNVLTVPAWRFSISTGRWDQFAKLGRFEKDGASVVFDENTLGQIVDNFAGRQNDLGMDHEHQALNAPLNGQPAPALAWYSALALVVGGKLVRFASHDTSVPKPDPAGLEDGLYGFRARVTPLGEQLLPNYRYISPAFTTDGANEEGEPIGYDLLNIAATNTPFLDGMAPIEMRRSAATSMSDPSPITRPCWNCGARAWLCDNCKQPYADRGTRGGACRNCGEDDWVCGSCRAPLHRFSAVDRGGGRHTSFDVRSDARDSFAGDVVTCPDCMKPGVKVIGISPRLADHDKPSGGRCPSSGKYVTEFARGQPATAMARDTNGREIQTGDTVVTGDNSARKGTVVQVSGDQVTIRFPHNTIETHPGRRLQVQVESHIDPRDMRVAMARVSGYVYHLESGGDWRGAPDDEWDTVVRSVDGEVVGRRQIDGSTVVVISSGGEFYAALPQNVSMSRARFARDTEGAELHEGDEAEIVGPIRDRGAIVVIRDTSMGGGDFVIVKAPDGSQRSIHGGDLKKLSRIGFARSLEELKTRYRELNRALADERLPEAEANALRRERDQVQEEIRRHPDARTSDMRASTGSRRMTSGGSPMCPKCSSTNLGYSNDVPPGQWAPSDVAMACRACGAVFMQSEIKRYSAMARGDIRIERTSDGRWRVFVERPDGFEVVGVYATEAEAKRAAEEAPARGFRRSTTSTTGARRFAKEMSPMDPKTLMARLGLADGAPVEEKLAKFAHHFASGEATPEDMRAMADALEEHKDDEGAAKMARHFKKFAEPVAPFNDAETPEEEAKEHAALASMARTLGLPDGARPSQIAVAFSAKTAPLTTVADLQGKVARLEEQLAARAAAETTARAQAFARQAVTDGRTTADKAKLVEETFIQGGDKAAEALLFQKGTFTVLRRFTTGGEIPGKANPPTSDAQPEPDDIRGRVAAKANEIMESARKAGAPIAFAVAMSRVRSVDPDLYAAYAALGTPAR